ncbi:hypothetical protein [Streptomyces sp. NPDC008121]|uniref:hypothetical protein n=1 Tax=Streptomyces sp. NPDC008121 TaxID=3364809 RepID=UPI0036E661B8
MAVSLKDAVDSYIQAGQSSAGAASLRRSVLIRLVQYFPGREFTGITARDLAQYLYGAGGIAAEKKASTAAGYRSCLKGFAYRLGVGWSADTPVIVMWPPRASEQLLTLKTGLH